MKRGLIGVGVILVIFGLLGLLMSGGVGYLIRFNNGLEIGYVACGSIGLMLIVLGSFLLIFGAITPEKATEHDMWWMPADKLIKKYNVKCPRCKNKVEHDFELCPYCGIKLKKALYCSRCGKKVEPEFPLCPFCGNKL